MMFTHDEMEMVIACVRNKVWWCSDTLKDPDIHPTDFERLEREKASFEELLEKLVRQSQGFTQIVEVLGLHRIVNAGGKVSFTSEYRGNGLGHMPVVIVEDGEGFVHRYEGKWHEPIDLLDAANSLERRFSDYDFLPGDEEEWSYEDDYCGHGPGECLCDNPNCGGSPCYEQGE